ncbi:MAG: YHS domain-containing protein [Sporichthyaceae bacterium]
MSDQPVDLVCGMKVDPATAPKSTVQGNDYWFCCTNCQKTFNRKPALYIGHAPGR